MENNKIWVFVVGILVVSLFIFFFQTKPTITGKAVSGCLAETDNTNCDTHDNNEGNCRPKVHGGCEWIPRETGKRDGGVRSIAGLHAGLYSYFDNEGNLKLR